MQEQKRAGGRATVGDDELNPHMNLAWRSGAGKAKLFRKLMPKSVMWRQERVQVREVILVFEERVNLFTFA